MKAIELLAPAGSPEALDAAINEGADAVYLGLKNFNARLRTSNFAYSQFEGAVKSLHRMGKKIYVTVNTVFEQREADRMYQFLKYLATIEPDGIIVQDLGVSRMVRQCFPTLKLHASTQMNISSARGANVLSRQGFSRVVLSRELYLEEIRTIRERTTVELEVFVHGALCVSESGLCLFSSYLGGKSANRGMCTQACRRLYRVNEESGYYFSPADLQLLDQVPALADMGIASLKIEGRMKSAEYVGTVVSAYRHLLDNIEGDQEKALAEAKAILKHDFARPKTSFYMEAQGSSAWLDPNQAGGTGIPLGKIIKVKGGETERRGMLGKTAITIEVGDSIRLHKKDDSDRQSHKINFVETTEDGVWISIPDTFDVGDSVYIIQTRAMTKRYPSVLPKDLSPFRRMPGRETAPPVQLPKPEKQDKDKFPEGIYVAVSRIEDLYIVQSVKPVRVMLSYTRAVAQTILDRKEGLPFSKNELILVFDPYYPEALDSIISEEIPQLLAVGYRQFVVNNIAHLSLFRGTDAQLIAGPYLYTFNSWSFAQIHDMGFLYKVSPLENNRQNLERTVCEDLRPFTFVTLFAYPALFRIRADLSKIYRFQYFSDGKDENFRLLSSPEGSFVLPEKPLSIIDKETFLKDAGFRRFILDFSGPPLKKVDYKDVMVALKAGKSLPQTTRFNWKDGFYANPDEGPKKPSSLPSHPRQSRKPQDR
ncbi:peptidase U32 family protein [Gracilinema caldarium]|uniref:Peptidase U32 n=1 Tax=Gracilinema caldarium (strain ATCC 51460 / DSM 7334 / H1) TaxID=744872 RepID=F8EZF5_GRAC1|nr:peptidase U32 family protein [Gracilinema caldarium]AEJ20178.1 peptidase U32 [Gracilinema caldarium DSM 7334]